VWSFQKLNVTWNDSWICTFAAHVCAELGTSIFCYKSVISMIWEFFWSVLHVCRTKIEGFENLSHNSHTHDPRQLPGCSWGDYAIQVADQWLKLKLETLSVWEIWVLEVLTFHSSDTTEKTTSLNRVKCEFKKYSRPLWSLSAKLKGRFILRSIHCIIYKGH
jgi:hypothetical protein